MYQNAYNYHNISFRSFILSSVSKISATNVEKKMCDILCDIYILFLVTSNIDETVIIWKVKFTRLFAIFVIIYALFLH